MRAKMRRLSSTQNWSVKGSEAMVGGGRQLPGRRRESGFFFSLPRWSVVVKFFLFDLAEAKEKGAEQIETDFEEDEKRKKKWPRALGIGPPQAAWRGAVVHPSGGPSGLCAGEALLEARTQASVAFFKLGSHSATLRPEFGGP